MSKSISDVKEARDELEREIHSRLQQFSREYEVEIVRVRADTRQTPTQGSLVADVNIEVSI